MYCHCRCGWHQTLLLSMDKTGNDATNKTKSSYCSGSNRRHPSDSMRHQNRAERFSRHLKTAGYYTMLFLHSALDGFHLHEENGVINPSVISTFSLSEGFFSKCAQNGSQHLSNGFLLLWGWGWGGGIAFHLMTRTGPLTFGDTEDLQLTVWFWWRHYYYYHYYNYYSQVPKLLGCNNKSECCLKKKTNVRLKNEQ